MFLGDRSVLEEQDAVVVDEGLVEDLIDAQRDLVVVVVGSRLVQASPVYNSVEIPVIVVVSTDDDPVPLLVGADVVDYLSVLDWVLLEQQIRICTENILLEVKMVCRVKEY